MKAFHPDNRNRSRYHQQLFANYQILYTVVEVLTGIAFIVGSVFFFYPSLEMAGIWLFVIGSVLFSLRPAVNLARELHFAVLERRGHDGARGAAGGD